MWIALNIHLNCLIGNANTLFLTRKFHRIISFKTYPHLVISTNINLEISSFTIKTLLIIAIFMTFIESLQRSGIEIRTSASLFRLRKRLHSNSGTSCKLIHKQIGS